MGKDKSLEEELDRVAKMAILRGFITIRKLISIMAEEEEYRGIIPKLWDLYFPNAAKGRTKLDTFERRKEAWFFLINRWTGRKPKFESSGKYDWTDLGRMEEIRLIELSYHQNGKFLTPISPLRRRGYRKPLIWIYLPDLKEYFLEIGRAFRMEFPLPKRLFAEAVTEDQSLPDLSFSLDFRNITIDGEKFVTTPRQAQVLQLFTEAAARGENELSHSMVIRAVSPDTNTRSIREFFKKDIQVYKALFEHGSRKDTIRLKRTSSSNLR